MKLEDGDGIEIPRGIKFIHHKCCNCGLTHRVEPEFTKESVILRFFGLENKGEGCMCQGCKRIYKVDILVPDKIWERIKPGGKAVGAGLLCGLCIMDRIESLGRFGAYDLKEV